MKNAEWGVKDGGQKWGTSTPHPQSLSPVEAEREETGETLADYCKESVLTTQPSPGRRPPSPVPTGEGQAGKTFFKLF